VIRQGYPITIIAEDRKDAWQRYQIKRGPAFIFVADGQEKSRHVGSLTVSRIKNYWRKLNL